MPDSDLFICRWRLAVADYYYYYCLSNNLMTFVNGREETIFSVPNVPIHCGWHIRIYFCRNSLYCSCLAMFISILDLLFNIPELYVLMTGVQGPEGSAV